MTTIAIIIAVLLFVLFFRFGLAVAYSDAGLVVKARVGPFSLRAYPRKEPSERKKRRQKLRRMRKAEKPKRERRRKEKKRKPEEEEPGSLESFITIFAAVKNVMGRVRRRLLIKRLILHYVSASEDPMKTALAYGGLSAAQNGVVHALDASFRIRKRELTASADFENSKPRIYVNAAISIAVWESLYIFFAILPAIGAMKRVSGKTAGKDGHDNGKTPDQ